MIGFGNEPNPVFALTFRQCCREVPALRRHGGLGFTPASSILTSKCDACVNAASYGDEALCTDLHAPTCQSAGISRKDLNRRPTRVNITANRFSEGGVCGWWQPYNMFAENI